jgi:hypothetical protein
LIIKRTTHKNSTKWGSITLPRYFIDEYEKMAKKNEKQILNELILFIPKENKVFPYYIKLKEINND